MAKCPACFGEGQHDMRDLDAFLLEHFTAEQIRQKGGEPYCGIVQCEECEGTGVVTEDRRKDLMAVSMAFVDQTIQRCIDEARGEYYSGRFHFRVGSWE